MNGINPDALSGWGVALVRKGLPTLWAKGSLPLSVLEKLAKKKTYIFFLETVAQCLGAWLFAEDLEIYTGHLWTTRGQVFTTKG